MQNHHQGVRKKHLKACNLFANLNAATTSRLRIVCTWTISNWWPCCVDESAMMYRVAPPSNRNCSFKMRLANMNAPSKRTR